MNRIEVCSYVLSDQLPGSRSTFLASRSGESVEYVVKTVVGDFREERFQQSARALGREPSLCHHLCSIVEVGVLPHLVFAVAPRLDGMNLARVVRTVHDRDSAALTLRGAYGASFLISELATAYHELRSSWTGSQPIKFSPDSAFVCRDGGVRILDPRWVDLRRAFEQPPAARSLAHDLAYYVPQYHQAFLKHQDEPIWGLSVVLWELLTGFRLFRRESLVDTLHALTKAEILDPREFNLNVPDSLARWLTETLRHPERRSLETYAEELADVGHGSALGGSLALEEWLMDLEGMSAVARDGGREGSLDALLDGDAVTWSSSEASTTYTSGPPSIADLDPDELVWLEDEGPLSVLPTVTDKVEPEDEPTRPFRRALLGASAVLLGIGLAHGMFRSLPAPPPPPDEAPAARAAPSGTLVAVAERVQAPEATRKRVVNLPDTRIEAELPRQQPPKATRLPKSSGSGDLDRTTTPALSSSDERSGFGFLTIDAPPMVTSVIDGRVLGEGRVEVRLPVGEQTVRFSWPGEEGQEVRLRIKPGALTQVAVSPEP